VRSTAAPYTESRLTRSVANERVGFPVVEQLCSTLFLQGQSPQGGYLSCKVFMLKVYTTLANKLPVEQGYRHNKNDKNDARL